VRQRAEGKGLTAILVLAVASAVLGSSTQFGYNSGVINSSKQVCAQPKPIPSLVWSGDFEVAICMCNCISVQLSSWRREVVCSFCH